VNKDQIENLCELVAHLSALSIDGPSDMLRNRLRSAAYRAQEIHKHARTLTRYAEKECNEGLSPTQQRMQESEQQRIADFLRVYGLKATFSGDPRGYVVKIQGLPGNTWSGDSEGFGVG
jgi:hypothetical protein